MVEDGADIKFSLRFGTSQTAQAIAQLLHYNCFSWYKEGAAAHRHSKDSETPFPVYIGMSVFTKTRKRSLVEMLHKHGMSISYDRVLEISAQLGDATVSKYVEEGVGQGPVCWLQLSIHHNLTMMLMWDFLTGRPQRVLIGSHTSSTFNTGTPQGCVLSYIKTIFSVSLFGNSGNEQRTGMAAILKNGMHPEFLLATSFF